MTLHVAHDGATHDGPARRGGAAGRGARLARNPEARALRRRRGRRLRGRARGRAARRARSRGAPASAEGRAGWWRLVARRRGRSPLRSAPGGPCSGGSPGASCASGARTSRRRCARAGIERPAAPGARRCTRRSARRSSSFSGWRCAGGARSAPSRIDEASRGRVGARRSRAGAASSSRRRTPATGTSRRARWRGDVELLVVTKHLRVRWLDRFWQSTRARLGVRLADARGALARGARRCSRRGGAVAMMIDQVPASPRQRRRASTSSGAPALVDRAPRALAARTGAPLVVAASRARRRGEHVLHVLAVLEPPARVRRRTRVDRRGDARGDRRARPLRARAPEPVALAAPAVEALRCAPPCPSSRLPSSSPAGASRAD